MPILKPGCIIGGYEILEFHRKGGMGEVYRAKQLSIDREVALKLLLPERARSDPAFAKRFVDEARAAGNLSHPGIIAVHDVARVKLAGSDEHLYFFTMEFVQGEDLKVQTRDQGHLPYETIGSVILVMADVLDYAQRKGVIHRDIKPENILLTKDGRPKLADFGICAKETETDDDEGAEKPKHRVVMGTPAYMSPEQAQALTIDWRSDQYSLGATLFFLLTEEPPFRGANARELMRAHVTAPIPDPRNLVPEIPACWAELCMRMMAKNPAERFETAADIAQAVQKALSGHDAPRKRNVGSTASRSNAKVRLAWIPAVGIAAAAVVGIAGFLLFRAPSETGVRQENAQQDNSLDQEQRLKIAETLIKGLDSDPVKAEAKITGPDALGSPYFAKTPKALSLFQAKRDELRAVIAVNTKKATDALLDRIRRTDELLAQHKLKEARSLFQSFTAEDQRLVGLQLHTLANSIATESASQANVVITTISACTMTELANHAPEKHQEILFDADLKRIQDAIKNRRSHLELLAKKQQEAEAAKMEALGQKIQNLHSKALELQGLSGLDPAVLAQECRTLASSLTPEQKETVKQLEVFVLAVQKNQERLDQYLNRTGIVVVFDGRSLRPLKHQNRVLFFDTQFKVSIALNDPRLDIVDIVSGALSSGGVSKADLGIQAAVLLWSLGSSSWLNLAQTRAEDPLCSMLLRLDSLALRRVLREPKACVLNLSAEAPRYQKLFVGDGLTATIINKKPILRWSTESRRNTTTAPQLLPGIELPLERASLTKVSLRFRPLPQSQCMIVVDVPKGPCLALAVDGRSQRLAAGAAIQPAQVPMKPQLFPPGSMLDGECVVTLTLSGDTWKLHLDGKSLCECKFPATGTFKLRLATFQNNGLSGADLLDVRIE